MCVDENIFQGYNFDLPELLGWLRKNKVKCLAVQLPEGLKRQALDLIQTIEKELGIHAILVADPCFGACDLVHAKLEILDVDGIVHFGHSEIPNCPQGQIPIKYIELRADVELGKLLQKKQNLDALLAHYQPPAALGIISSIQFTSHLNTVRDVLENEGYGVEIGNGDSRVKYPGQVLGCNFSAARNIQDKVDVFVYIGDGTFHPLGVSLATNKKVLVFDPFREVFEDIGPLRDRILRQRSGVIAKAKDCKDFGILISTKPGQNRKEYALELKQKIIEHGHRALLITVDNITPDKIEYLPFDGFVNTACPRLTIDDLGQYKKVVLTPVELMTVLGERDWDGYKFDEIL